MKSLAWALRQVDEAPRGPRVVAFFDLDGTLVQGFTALSFLRDSVSRGDITTRDLIRIAGQAVAYRFNPDSGVNILEGAVQLMEGRSLQELLEISAKVFTKRIAPTIRPEARELLHAHFRAGHTVVLATAATSFQAHPVAEDLGIEHVLCTEVEVEDGILTGRVSGNPAWGHGKARRVEEFLATHDVDKEQSFAYGNGAEDWMFLNTVGRPVAVTPDRGLVRRIRGTDIPVLSLENPPSLGVSSFLGTLSAVAVFNAGIFSALLTMPFLGRRGAFDMAAAPTASWSLAAAGIRLRIHGREHLGGARPAIVMFNHQSGLDPLVVAILLERQFTGIGKIELSRGIRGAAFWLLGIAFVDRGNSEAAKASVNALVDRIQAGESVIIAPEGTRTPTARLGRFKKGGFHLAISAGVPVVPIVFRNAGAHWPPRSMWVRPGTLEVRVLPPIDTSGWSRDTLDAHVAEVRERFEQTLLDEWGEAQDRVPPTSA